MEKHRPNLRTCQSAAGGGFAALLLRLLALALLLPLTAQAQKFWEKKDFRAWTEQECRRMLSDSPWARTHVIGRSVLQELATRTGDRARENAPVIEYQVQIRSALPVRRAMVRLQMLEARYDSLSKEQKREFDSQAERFLAAAFSDRVVIFVISKTNVEGYVPELTNYWRTRNPEQMRKVINLYGARGKIFEPARYAAAGDAAFQLAFARTVDGRPIIAAEDREFRLEFISPAIGSLASERVLVTFRVRDMLQGGKVIF